MARAKLYGRIGKQIQQAVRSGGPSDSNATLQAVLNVRALTRRAIWCLLSSCNYLCMN